MPWATATSQPGGALPECDADTVHSPGTYAAGCYDRLESEVAGQRVENEDLVNLPNWLPLRFRTRETGTVEDTATPWFTPDTHTPLDHRLRLDLRAGILERTTRYADGAGRHLLVRQLRLVHLGDPHLAALRTELTAEDWSGQLEVESTLDGTVANTGVARYRQPAPQHLTHVHTGTAPAGDTIWLRCRTRTSDIRVGMAARTTTDGTGATATATAHEPGRASVLLRLRLERRRTVTVDKCVALHTSRDPAISDPLHAAIDRVGRAPDFGTLMRSHRTAWDQLWRACDVDVPGDAGRILRLHLFHLLQTLSPHSADLDVGVPARGLHGEAYRGHVFWDELFVLPFLNLHFTEVSRALLNYRHRRWNKPASRPGTPDGRARCTRGRAGATAARRPNGCISIRAQARGRYRILGVVGPDEYHDAYPGASRPGIDDNAYTNATAAWGLARALDLLRSLPQPRRRDLFERTELADAELDVWEDVSRRLLVPWHHGLIGQFEGCGELAELNWDRYRSAYGDIRRLDRILEAEGDTVNRYQASKQADVLMLGYLSSPRELHRLFRRLGYELDDTTWQRTVDYYLRRTCHGSTLSSLVHAWVLPRVRRADAWRYCREALAGDIADLQGGTTGEGIHLGAMAGALDLVQRGLTGLEPHGGTLRLDPVPLPELSRFGLSIRYRGHWGVRLRLTAYQMRITVSASDREPIDVALGDRTISVPPGETCLLPLPL